MKKFTTDLIKGLQEIAENLHFVGPITGYYHFRQPYEGRVDETEGVIRGVYYVNGALESVDIVSEDNEGYWDDGYYAIPVNAVKFKELFVYDESESGFFMTEKHLLHNKCSR